MVERVSAAVADIAREAERTPPGARLVLQVLAHNGGERVAARLLPDNYHDTMTTSLLVNAFLPLSLDLSLKSPPLRRLLCSDLPWLLGRVSFLDCTTG